VVKLVIKRIDQAIIQLQKGRKKYFEVVIDTYEQKVYGFILSIVKDPHVTQDLLQDTFIKAYKNMKAYDNTRSFSTWLLTIARNVAYDYMRKNKKLSIVEDIDSIDYKTPETELLANEYRRSIDELVEALPDHLSTLIHMKYFEELSYEEIASRLNIDKNKVRWQLYEARKKLERDLQDKEVVLCNVK